MHVFVKLLGCVVGSGNCSVKRWLHAYQNRTKLAGLDSRAPSPTLAAEGNIASSRTGPTVVANVCWPHTASIHSLESSSLFREVVEMGRKSPPSLRIFHLKTMSWALCRGACGHWGAWGRSISGRLGVRLQSQTLSETKQNNYSHKC